MHRKRQASHSKTRPLFATPNRRHLTSARSRVNISIARKRRATREPRRARSRRGRALNSTILPQPAYRGASSRRGTQRSLGGRIFDAKTPRARAPRREPQKCNTPRAARVEVRASDDAPLAQDKLKALEASFLTALRKKNTEADASRSSSMPEPPRPVFRAPPPPPPFRAPPPVQYCLLYTSPSPRD